MICSNLLVMSGTALETRTALMNVLTALPHQHDSSAPGGQPGQLSQLPAMPQQAPGHISGPQGKHRMEAPALLGDPCSTLQVSDIVL